MRDKRPVDELSIEELERILAIRRREERQQKIQRFKKDGRVIEAQPAAQVPQPPPTNGQTAKRKTVVDPVVVNAADPHPRFEDGAEAEELMLEDAEEAERRWKRFVNGLLLVVEVAAVFGLIFIGFNLFGSIQALQRETASAQQLANEQREAGIPTAAPTAILSVKIDDYVLPGGHTIDDSGNVLFNYAEFINDVPSHLQTSVQNQVFPSDSYVRPPATSETALLVNIPRLGLDQSIVQGTDWEALKNGVGQVLNGVNPGDETGNVVLAAHNDIYGELFRYLDTMEIGDEIAIQTATQTYTYRVTGSDVVDPTDVYVMANQGRPTATLISCYPYGVNNKRYVVFAERVDLSY